jgi:hypothetical protein
LFDTVVEGSTLLTSLADGFALVMGGMVFVIKYQRVATIWLAK